MLWKRLMALGATLALAGSIAVPGAAAEPPANDTYDGRTMIDAFVTHQTYSFNLSECTGGADDAVVTSFAQTIQPNCADVAGPASAWFQFIPSRDGSLSLQGAALYGAHIVVVEGALDDLQDLEYCGPLGSPFLVAATAGTAHTILVMQYVGDPGPVDLHAHCYPPASLAVGLDEVNGIDPKSGAATIKDTYACEYASWLNVWVDIAQEKGKANSTPSGNGQYYAFSPVCDGVEHPWSAAIEPVDGLFKSGPATVSVLAEAEDALGSYVSDAITDGLVKLSPAKSLR